VATQNTTAGGAARGALVRSVALPSEHGGWSFLLEPVALGLAVAPSLPGAILAVAVLAAFLTHQPLKTAVKDRLSGRRAFRTVWAERFALAYGSCALVALGLVVWLAGWWFAAALLPALPFAAVQLAWDARNRSRALVAELCGAAALGAVASAIAVLGGWALAASAGLWLVLAARSAPSIMYVRERLKLERGRASARAPSLAAHAAALAAVSAAAAAGLVPWHAAAAMGVLLARAALGLSAYRFGRRAPAIGMQEIAFGLLTVVLTAVGYARG
jgi:hypothetical protein